MNHTRYQIDAEALAHYSALRDEAISDALAASEQAFPEIYARFRERGRAACAEDIGFHLEFLRPTLENGELAPFTGYLGWLVQVLSSRNVPHQSVLQSLDDLGAFFLRRMGEAGTPIADALWAGKAALERGIAAPRYDSHGPARGPEAKPFATAATAGDRHTGAALLDQAFEREQSLPLVAVRVIQPALYEVGRLWEQNQVSVVQEHTATALSESWMARSMGRAVAAPENGRRAVFACLPGNHHVVGLRMVADAFELDGWTSTFLGANTPLEKLVDAVAEGRPHLVGFSASLPQQLRGLRQGISGLRGALRDACPQIVVGGLVFNQYPGLARWVGAQVLGADAVTAAAAASRAGE